MALARVFSFSQRARARPGQAGFAGARAARAAWTRSARAAGAMGPLPRGRHSQEFNMTLNIYPIVLELVRKLSPYLPALRARSTSLGDQLERSLISIPL